MLLFIYHYLYNICFHENRRHYSLVFLTGSSFIDRECKNASFANCEKRKKKNIFFSCGFNFPNLEKVRQNYENLSRKQFLSLRYIIFNL